MKVRVTAIVDIGEPAKWRREVTWGGRVRRVRDRRRFEVILKGRLLAAVGGIEEYLGVVDDAEIEVIE